jgi:soluble lytic murein transglycosylase-like protein
VARHRSPGGRRARSNILRERSAHPVSSVRVSVLAGAAAIGAVATGTCTTLATMPGTTPAAADEPLETALAASSSPLATPTVAETLPVAAAVVAPVAVALTETEGVAEADAHLAQLDKASVLAAELAELHAAEARERAEQARIDGVIASGGLDGWIAEALRVMDLPQGLAPGVRKIIIHESGGNPRAVNNWDSNAQRGTPSRGLMQTIPSTFRKFVHPSLAHRSITDPVANITAGVRYMIATYGIGTLENGGRRSSSGGYVGY